LRPEQVKDRLLGHWGTCPGINLVYAHLNRLILRDDLDAMLITGPGHGAPANFANLYLEGSLSEFYPELTHDAVGVERRMGCNPHAFGGRVRRSLGCPPVAEYAVEIHENNRGEPEKGPVAILAKYLSKVIVQNPGNFRIFSPDELMSNKLGGIFEAPIQPNYQWPVENGDRAEHIGSHGGRVLEILSEHTCQGWLQGYLLTGRHGLFPSYESFLPIVTSMMINSRSSSK
jgi:phosphoketolase